MSIMNVSLGSMPCVCREDLEAVLFAAVTPLSVRELSEIFEVEEENILTSIDKLLSWQEEASSGLRVRLVGDSVDLVTYSKASLYIEKIRMKEERLSKACLETLAVIAFKQPITKAEIEEFRGVNCERVLKQLLDKGLIDSLGRKHVIGRPILYGTTEHFLRSIGAHSLEELQLDIKDVGIAQEVESTMVAMEDE